MKKTFGEFNEELPESQEGLTIVFSPTSTPLKQRWRNNGLSADFIADYFTTFFPGGARDTAGIGIKDEVKSAVSFIANELLENAMKFHDDTSPYPISIRLQLHHDKLVFKVTNSINGETAAKFQALIEELTTTDTDDLYMRQLEKSAEDESSSESGLGLLTIINDYQAQMGWKFETVQREPEVFAVTIMVQLTV